VSCLPTFLPTVPRLGAADFCRRRATRSLVALSIKTSARRMSIVSPLSTLGALSVAAVRRSPARARPVFARLMSLGVLDGRRSGRGSVSCLAGSVCGGCNRSSPDRQGLTGEGCSFRRFRDQGSGIRDQGSGIRDQGVRESGIRESDEG
jgi:hypothetical protein